MELCSRGHTVILNMLSFMRVVYVCACECVLCSFVICCVECVSWVLIHISSMSYCRIIYCWFFYCSNLTLYSLYCVVMPDCQCCHTLDCLPYIIYLNISAIVHFFFHFLRKK